MKVKLKHWLPIVGISFLAGSGIYLKKNYTNCSEEVRKEFMAGNPDLGRKILDQIDAGNAIAPSQAFSFSPDDCESQAHEMRIQLLTIALQPEIQSIQQGFEKIEKTKEECETIEYKISKITEGGSVEYDKLTKRYVISKQAEDGMFFYYVMTPEEQRQYEKLSDEAFSSASSVGDSATVLQNKIRHLEKLQAPFSGSTDVVDIDSLKNELEGFFTWLSKRKG